MDLNWIIDAPFQPLPVGDPEGRALSIDGVDHLTYRELRALRDRYVAALRARGVGSGDRVGMMLLNSLDYAALYFAITRIGAIAVRLNFRLAAPELEYIIDDASCRVVVLHTSRLPQLAPVHEALEVEHWLTVTEDTEVEEADWATPVELPDAEAPVDLPRPNGADPLMLMYTSGTTGRPKGVVWTHDTALWVASIQVAKWRYTSDTVTMTTGPMYHAGAFEILVLPAMLAHGTGVVMSSGGMTTTRITEAIRAGGVHQVLLYPFQLYDLLRSDVSPDDLPSLRAILSGGDPVLPWALTAVDERFPAVELEQGYGLTEATMIMSLDHADRLTHPDSVGRPMPLTDVRTMRPDGTEAAPDEVGEVWIRSAAVAAGYWNQPEATEKTFGGGWCRTGDLGRITPDGFLVLTGRAKDMIRSGGENIYPAEVEAVLSDHPLVDSVGVIAVPHATYLEVGCAVVVLTDEAGDRDEVEDTLREHARSRLAGYKCPAQYEFVDALPVNGAGKLQKHVLRDQYASLGTPPGDGA